MLRGILNLTRMPIAAAALMIAAALASSPAIAECNGCTPHDEPVTAVCSASCLTEGYTLTVVKDIPGGPSLPDGCSGSATGQYLVLEGTAKKQNYSQTEYLAIANDPNHPHTHVDVLHPGPNDLYCDANDGFITPPVYVVTFANTQGVRACIPAREANIDCGDASFMARHFNLRGHLIGMPIVPMCHDSCNGTPHGGTGGTDQDRHIGSLAPGGFTYAGKLTADPNPINGGNGGGVHGPKVGPGSLALNQGARQLDDDRTACIQRGGRVATLNGKILCTVLPQAGAFAETKPADQGKACSAVFDKNKATIESMAGARNIAGIRSIFSAQGCPGAEVSLANQPQSLAKAQSKMRCTFTLIPPAVICTFGIAAVPVWPGAY
jgi:hypothetical protein